MAAANEIVISRIVAYRYVIKKRFNQLKASASRIFQQNRNFFDNSFQH